MVEALFEERLGARVLAVADMSVGVEQQVSRVETDRGVFVLKRPLADAGINEREAVATRLAAAAGVPVPRVVWHDPSCLVETFLEGTPLDRCALSFEERCGLWREWGGVLRRLHTVSLDGFGRLTASGRGEVDDYLDFYASRGAEGPADGPARRYFSQHRRYLRRPRGVLVHFDMEEEHVLVKDGRIVGLVDFASAFSGSPMEEFTRLYGLRWKDPLFGCLLEGYGEVDMEELRFFTFLHLHWRIPWHVGKGNRPEKVALLTGLYRKIVGRP